MAEGDKKQSKRTRLSVAYHLFRYQEELRSRKARALNFSKMKYNLLNGLVATTWNNMTCYNKEEREHLINSIVYKNKLKKKIDKKSKKRGEPKAD